MSTRLPGLISVHRAGRGSMEYKGMIIPKKGPKSNGLFGRPDRRPGTGRKTFPLFYHKDAGGFKERRP